MGDWDSELEHPGFWRQEVFARARRLEVAFPQAKNAAGAKDLLKVARETAAQSMGPFTWWNGTLEERAWLALHDAEVALLRAMKDKAAISWWEWATGRIKPQVGAPPGMHAALRIPATAAEAAHSLRSYYDWSDRLFAETRALRNRLICLTALGLVTTVLLVIAGIVGWLQIKSGRAAIVSGTEQFWLVALFGAIGAFITGVPKLAAVVRSLPPYTTSPYQLALKLVTGPVFALIGVLALARGFVDIVAPLSHFSGTVLLWAIIFGGTQQLLTGLLDRKAAILTGEHEARWSGMGT